MKIKLYPEDRWICKNCGVKDCDQSDEELEYCLTDDMSSEMLVKFYEERTVDE